MKIGEVWQSKTVPFVLTLLECLDNDFWKVQPIDSKHIRSIVSVSGEELFRDYYKVK